MQRNKISFEIWMYQDEKTSEVGRCHKLSEDWQFGGGMKIQKWHNVIGTNSRGINT